MFHYGSFHLCSLFSIHVPSFFPILQTAFLTLFSFPFFSTFRHCGLILFLRGYHEYHFTSFQHSVLFHITIVLYHCHSNLFPGWSYLAHPWKLPSKDQVSCYYLYCRWILVISLLCLYMSCIWVRLSSIFPSLRKQSCDPEYFVLFYREISQGGASQTMGDWITSCFKILQVILN